MRKIQRNPSIKSRNIIKILILNISFRIMRRRLKDVNLKSCLASANHTLIKCIKKKCLAFAKKYVKPLSF